MISKLRHAMFLRRFPAVISPTKRAFTSKFHEEAIDSQIINELNQEMQSIFGSEPSSSSSSPDGFSGSPITESKPKTESQNPEKSDPISKLTHVGSSGEAEMVDVSFKDNTKRTALASCKVLLGRKVFDLVLANQMKKGDVLGVSKIAGINGAKQTSNLIPLCHNIALTHVRVDLRLNCQEFCVEIEGEASSSGKTGVEMEALMAVSVAGLTVYDMCKAASKGIRITDVRLEKKSGGKSGDWSRSGSD